MLDAALAGRWGLDEQVSAQIGDGKRWRTGGEWAEDVALGSQPGILERSVTEWGRFAVRGRIEPSALRLVERDDAGRWTPPAP